MIVDAKNLVVRRRRTAAISLLCALALAASAPALAQEPGAPGYTGPALEIPIPGVEFSGIIRENGSITVPWLAQYVGGVYTFLLSIAGMLAAVMMVVGGFQYVTAAGDKGRIGKAKKRITDALTGLVLALGSYTILYAINPELVAFEGLKIGLVNTELLEANDSLSNEHLTPDAIPSDSPPAAPAVLRGGYAKLCDSAASCLPYCQRAGCTKIFCTKDEIAAGYGQNCINDTRGNDCDWDKFPSLNSPTALDASSPELIPSSRWPAMTHVKPRGGVKASRFVLEGLQRADRYIAANYPGQGLVIQINNCWRDWRDDANAQCSIIARPTKNNPVNWYSSWPGAGPHNSGYACDMVLTKDGKAISGVKSDQRCASKVPGSKLLVDILTNPTVGARRLNYESWHFNWAGWNSCFCAMSECDAHNPPVPSGDNKCTHKLEPSAC
jgi:hypothetical protein